MQNLINAQPKDLKKLNLKGIEIVKFIEGSNNSDFKMIELRDTVTNETLHVSMSPYSDFRIGILKPVEMVEKFRLTGNIKGVQQSFIGESEKECKDKVEELSIEDAKIEKIQVEKE